MDEERAAEDKEEPTPPTPPLGFSDVLDAINKNTEALKELTKIVGAHQTTVMTELAEKLRKMGRF